MRKAPVLETRAHRVYQIRLALRLNPKEWVKVVDFSREQRIQGELRHDGRGNFQKRRGKEAVNVAGNNRTSAQGGPVVNTPSTTTIAVTTSIVTISAAAIGFTPIEGRETK